MKNIKIPFSPPYIDKRVEEEVLNTLRSGWLTTGAKVAKLQTEIAQFCSVEQALCVNSATSGLMLALHWFGVGKGDEVIIPAYTYSSTALVVLHLGAKPIMVDVDDDFCISPQEIAKHINAKTKAIIPVDFAGYPCDYEAIFGLLNSPDTKQVFSANNAHQEMLGRPLLLADAAHSLGAFYQDKPTGSVADLSVFSFQAVKNITTAEGGAICFNLPQGFSNELVYKQLKLWSLNGQTLDGYAKNNAGDWKYDIVYPGFKVNMPDISASIALAQMEIYRAELLPKRLENYDLYSSLLAKNERAIIPKLRSIDRIGSGHIYPLRIKGATENDRNHIIAKLLEVEISANVHFTPLPLFTAFKNLGYQINNIPNSIKLYSNEISLPIYPQLSSFQIEYVVENLGEIIQHI